MTREIPLSRGLVALVDDADYAAVVALGAWQASPCGSSMYAGHAGNGWQIRLHVFLTGWPLTDHINGDGLDNRRSNLRLATRSQNGANSRRPRHNTSGYKGVSFYTRTGRWRAYIGVSAGAAQHLGYFATAEEAARVYDAAAVATWGEFARLNFPREDQPA